MTNTLTSVFSSFLEAQVCCLCSIRILPHQQNTAGMFIAVVQRVRTLEDVLKEEKAALLKG